MSSPGRNFSFQNGSNEFPFATAGEEAKGCPESLAGVEDLNGGNQGRALGGSRLSRRRHSCAGAAPWDRLAVPPQPGARTRACDSQQNGYSLKRADARRLAWSGMPPFGRTHRSNNRASLGPTPSSPLATSAKGRLAGPRGEPTSFWATLLVRSPPRVRCPVLAKDGFFATRQVLHKYRCNAHVKYHTLTF